jgi:NTP pyrophosphatase (non-canonical NTP hydrolase)
MKRTQLYQKAVETYGISAQEDMLLEEMAELSKVILKGRRGQLSTQDLTDEIADVEIMLEQMKQHFGIGDEVKARKRFKKERLGKRLEVRE